MKNLIIGTVLGILLGGASVYTYCVMTWPTIKISVRSGSNPYYVPK